MIKLITVLTTTPLSKFEEQVVEWISSKVISLIDGSYWFFLAVSLISLLFYFVGAKNAKKYIGFSVLTYFLVQCFKGVLK